MSIDKQGNSKMFGANLCLALSLVLIPGAFASSALSNPALAATSKESKSEAASKKDSDKKETDSKESATKEADKKDSAKASKGEKDKDKDKGKGVDKDDKKKDKVDKKALKEEEKAKKAAQAKAEEEAKKSGKKGFFGFGGKAEAKNNKETKPVEPAKPAATPEVKAEAKPAVPEKKAEEKLPDFAPDTALISVLKDLNNMLKDSEEVKSLQDENEKFIVGLAQQVLDKALSDPKVVANRIVAKEDENRVKNHLTAESWSSGEIEVNDKFRGALSTVWAKRIGGLVTLTIAGNSSAKAPDGKPVNEFIVVLSAHSPVETGFDIQSQNNVTYWKGKLDKIAVESDLIKKAEENSDSQAPEAVKESDASSNDGSAKKKSLSLPPLLTERYRKHYELVVLTSARRQKLAEALSEPAIAPRPRAVIKRVVEIEEIDGSEDGVETTIIKKVPATATIKTKVTEAKLENLEEEDLDEAQKAIAKVDKEVSGTNEDKPSKVEKSATAETTIAKTESQNKAREVANSEKAIDKNKVSEAKTESVKTSQQENKTVATAKSETAAKANQDQENKIAMVAPRVQGESPSNHEGNQPDQSSEPVLRKPKSNSILVLPDRALAGQAMTVALLDEKRNPEPNIEICFNGLSLQTDHNGQVVYQVPEDATPGRSLNIAMPSRSEDLPAVVDVLHPLNFDTTSRQAPRLDRTNPLMTLGKRTMVVDGHNFDGMAQNNRIIIDGALEAQIIAASPVQLRFTVPAGSLRPGPHSLVVSCEGMRSNPVPFEFAAAEIPADAQNGKDGSKLTVKVLGTTSKVNVKIINLSPDIVRLSHDQDSDITSSGGVDNKAVVSLQRIKKGTYKLQAEIVL